MSADNGYIARINRNGKFVLQMYFDSDERYPDVNVGQGSTNQFDTLDDLIAEYETYINDKYWSEYGLTVKINQTKEKKTMLQTEQFIRNPFTIEAVRVTEDNFDEVRLWCNGTKHAEPKGEYIEVAVRNPLTPRQKKAFVGDWVLSSKSGFKVYTDSAFRSNFRKDGDNVSVSSGSFGLEPVPAAPVPGTSNLFDTPQELYTTDQSAVDPKDQIAGKRQ